MACEPRIRIELTARAHLHVARKHQAIHGADDGGIAQVLLRAGQRRLELRHLSLGFGDFRLADGDVSLGRELLVQRELIMPLSVVESGGRDQAVRCRLAVALDRRFQERHVRALRVHDVALVGGLGGLQAGLRRHEVGAGALHRGLQLLLIELDQQLPFLHRVAVIDIESS